MLSNNFDNSNGEASIKFGLINQVRNFDNIILRSQPDVSKVQIHTAEFYMALRLYNGKYVDDWV